MQHTVGITFTHPTISPFTCVEVSVGGCGEAVLQSRSAAPLTWFVSETTFENWVESTWLFMLLWAGSLGGGVDNINRSLYTLFNRSRGCQIKLNTNTLEH